MFSNFSWAENKTIDCAQEFESTGNCPTDLCVMQCKGGVAIDGCPLNCEPAPCVVISFKNCPLDRCDLLEGCNKEKVCYSKMSLPPKCGDSGYAGKGECCEGFVKRCGSAFFDGTCDMAGEKSIYSIPICVPCGNGVCNQFEDQCNCPEDCRPKN